MLKQEKEQIVAELVERLRTSATLIVADYRGLDMGAIDGVRTELLKHGARFAVVKNTLTKRAADAAGVEALDEFLEGPTAIAFVGDGDMVAVAKVLNDTARTTRILTIKGGILDGRPITADEVGNLATLPPVEVLQAQVVGAIVGPLNAIVGIFAAPLRDLVGVFDARIEQLREQGGPAEEPAADEPAAEAAPGAEDTVKAPGAGAEEAEAPAGEPAAEAAPGAEAATEDTMDSSEETPKEE